MIVSVSNHNRLASRMRERIQNQRAEAPGSGAAGGKGAGGKPSQFYYRNSMDCFRQTLQREGVRGLCVHLPLPSPLPHRDPSDVAAMVEGLKKTREIMQVNGRFNV